MLQARGFGLFLIWNFSWRWIGDYSIVRLSPIEMPCGKVHPFLDAWRMLIGLWRIRKRLKAGVY